MRYLVGFVFVLALGVMGCGETTGTGGSGGDGGDGGMAGAPEVVVQACEQELDCRPPSQPRWPVEECVERTGWRMSCLSQSESGEFLDELAACLELPCDHWFLSICPPRLDPCPLDGPCVAPLSRYCDQVDCPTWDEEHAKVECPGDWEVGTCGSLRYIWHQFFGNTSDYYVRYFDASGALVIHEHHSDYAGYCDSTSLEIFYGQVPNCELEPTELSREECRAAPRNLGVFEVQP
jgi:hypothetical protein